MWETSFWQHACELGMVFLPLSLEMTAVTFSYKVIHVHCAHLKNVKKHKDGSSKNILVHILMNFFLVITLSKRTTGTTLFGHLHFYKCHFIHPHNSPAKYK